MRLVAGNAYIFHFTYRYAIDGETLDNTARYINHSCDPNCEVEKTPDTIWIVALREITGEELTYNYGYDARNYQEIRATVVPRAAVDIFWLRSIGV